MLLQARETSTLNHMSKISRVPMRNKLPQAMYVPLNDARSSQPFLLHARSW